MQRGGLGRRSHLLAIVITISCGATVTGVRALAATPADASARAPVTTAAAVPRAAAPVRPAFADLVTAGAPLAFWRLNDGGQVAHDATGRHDGAIRGRVRVWQIAQGPGALSDSFDGSTGRVTVAAAGLAPGAVAASAWFRTPRRPAGSFGTVVDSGGIAVSVADGRIVVATCAAALPCSRLTVPRRVTDGAWHQVAVSVAGYEVTAYLDGLPAATGVTLGASARPVHGLVGIGRHFVGNINNVALYATPITATAVRVQFAAGACPQAAGMTPAVTSVAASPPALPLHTHGRYVVDSHGRRVKLAGVNWYGAEELDRVPAGLQCQPVDAIAAHIAAAGYNLVRLPWATDNWVGRDHPVPPVAVAANPGLRARGARAVFDAVVDSLARHGLMVVLDNHTTRPDWCCSNVDGNALWWEGYDPAHPPRWSHMSRRAKTAYFTRHQSRWLAAWRAIAARYGPHGAEPQPAVVGADLRNEPRVDSLLDVQPEWRRARVPVWDNWPRAATRAGNAVLRADPRLLVVVEGVNYATDLRGVAAHPLRLARAHRLVFSAHDYSFTEGPVSATELRNELDARWGWLVRGHRRYTTPVWIGEFGTCHPGDSGCAPREAAWFATFTRYLRDRDLDWAYWSVNGTGARGAAEPTTCAETLRMPGCDERFGLSDVTWARDASPELSSILHSLEAPRGG